MAAFRYSTSFRLYIVTSVTSQAADYPAENLRTLLYPLRTWRSTALGTQDIILDLGAPVILTAYMLGTANFPLVTVAISSSPTFASDVTTRFNAVSVPSDARVGRRKVYLDDAGNGLAKQYVRIRPSGTPDGGATYYELGVIALPDPVVQMTEGPYPYRYTRKQAASRVAFRDGGEDVAERGRVHLEMVLAAEDWRQSAAVQGELSTLLDAGMVGPILLYENQGDASKVYVCRRVEPASFSEQLTSMALSIPLREAI
jgi:hypothetical protein